MKDGQIYTAEGGRGGGAGAGGGEGQEARVEEVA